MTDAQIVLGSLMSRLYFVWVLLLSGLPIFCITMIYGGVTTAEVFESFGLDPLVPNAQRLHGLVEHSNYAEIPESPHNVYYETARQWNEVVSEFLSSETHRRS
ncbi:MAG: hypothetical protein IH908_15220 [Proteobacteria bacterium]|nr:hypothetical protein [Pseudomonadota bacterium]